MSLLVHSAVRRVATVALIAALSGCAAPPPSPAPPHNPRALDLNLPASSKKIEMPDRLGSPVVVVALEVPANAIREAEVAKFEVDFEVTLRGAVTGSRIVSSTHPQLDELIRKQHALWLYAVATRDAPCKATAYRASQRLELARRAGRLQMALEPAVLLDPKDVRWYERTDVSGWIPNRESVMSSIRYPQQAARDGVEAELALIVNFAADGTVADVFPVNSAYDKWGFAHAAIEAVRKLRSDPGRGAFVACQPVEFHLRE